MEQLFYSSFAHSSCEVSNNKNILEDVHSLGKFHVNSVVSNSKHFAKIFNCPMNPEHKCNLW